MRFSITADPDFHISILTIYDASISCVYILNKAQSFFIELVTVKRVLLLIFCIVVYPYCVQGNSVVSNKSRYHRLIQIQSFFVNECSILYHSRRRCATGNFNKQPIGQRDIATKVHVFSLTYEVDRLHVNAHKCSSNNDRTLVNGHY